MSKVILPLQRDKGVKREREKERGDEIESERKIEIKRGREREDEIEGWGAIERER